MRKVSMALSAGLLAATALAFASAGSASASSASAASVNPGSGFVYGSDSWPVPVTDKAAPYHEPVIGSRYGAYIGMAGNWARLEGCKTGNFLAWAPANAAQANANLAKFNTGVGVGVYWYMGGPGVDPHWTSSGLSGEVKEAGNWGTFQAEKALAAIKTWKVTYPVIWADIEMPLIAPATDNGWNSVYSSPCSGRVVQNYVPATVDRAEFNAFANYITKHSKYKVGVYSAPQVWSAIFGTGSTASIPNTYEWTYWPETSHLSQAPTGWCLHGSSTCARFFGGQTSASKYALAWQWSGGGGVTNGVGDFDQVDVARLK